MNANARNENGETEGPDNGFTPEGTPPRPEEIPWLEEIGWAAGCDPEETRYFIRHDDVRVWRRGGVPAGCVMLEWRAREVSLDILGVDPACRRQGLAGRMMRAVRDEALRRGIHRLRLVTSNDNGPALMFYQRLGLRIVAVHVGRPERRRGYVRPGHSGIPVRDDIEMVWDF